jgi:hypothetical protein
MTVLNTSHTDIYTHLYVIVTPIQISMCILISMYKYINIYIHAYIYTYMSDTHLIHKSELAS